MFPSTNSTDARPPSTWAQCSSPHIIFSVGSSRREGITRGRWPIRNACSATRAARLAERTEANVATASTRVPVAVASAEIVTQSVMGLDSVVSRASSARTTASPRPDRPVSVDFPAEACPSGRRGTPGERVGGQPSRGFESRGLRRDPRFRSSASCSACTSARRACRRVRRGRAPRSASRWRRPHGCVLARGSW